MKICENGQCSRILYAIYGSSIEYHVQEFYADEADFFFARSQIRPILSWFSDGVRSEMWYFFYPDEFDRSDKRIGMKKVGNQGME